MTMRNRAVGVALTAALVLACSPQADSPTPTPGAAGADLLAMLPQGSGVVFWMDFDALRSAELGSRIVGENGFMTGGDDMEDVQRFAAATGIDPTQDPHRLAVGVVADGSDRPPVAVVTSVTYDPDRLMAAVADQPTLTHGNRTLHELEPSMWEEPGEAADDAPDAGADAPADAPDEATETEPEEPGYLVVLDDETLLLGNEAGVRAALDTIDSGAPSVRDNPRIAELAARAADGSQMWMVASREAWEAQLDDIPASGLPVPQSAVEGIQELTFSLGVAEGLDIRLAGLAASAEDASLLADSLQGVVAMGKMMLQEQQPELFAILDRGVTVASDDRELRVEAHLTEADLEVLRGLAEEQRPAR